MTESPITKTTVTIEYEAYQWNGSKENLPEGFYAVEPEITWAASHKYLYFTYGSLHAKYWMGVDRYDVKPDDGEPYCCFTRDGIKHWRIVLPFVMWELKSEASVNARAGKINAYAPVFMDWQDSQLLELLTDYIVLMEWQDKLADGKFNEIEYREVSGAYGRGYAPHYLSKGDWLVKGPNPKSMSTMAWHVHKADEPWK